MKRLLLLFILIPSLCFGGMIIKKATPATPAAALCDGTETYCVAWNVSAATTTDRALNNSPGTDEDSFDSANGTPDRSDDISRTDDTIFGGTHYCFFDGGEYLITNTTWPDESWIYLKFRNIGTHATASKLLKASGGVIEIRNKGTSLEFMAYDGSYTVFDTATVSLDTVYHLILYTNLDTNVISYELYNAAETLIDSGSGSYTHTAPTSLLIGNDVSHNDCDLGLVKITTTEPDLVP